MNGYSDRFTTTWVRAAHRARLPVLVLALLASLAAAWLVQDRLGINTDTADMISPSLPWRQRDIEFDRQFPHFSDTLAIVIDGATPALADDAAGRLLPALSQATDTFHSVEWIEGHDFLRRNALLFMEAGDRKRLVDRLITAQPLLGRLHRDPGLAAVARLLDDALQPRGSSSPTVAADLVDRFVDDFARAVEATLDGAFHRLAWRRLVGGEAGPESTAGSRQILVARPVLDYDQAFPAADAQAVIREQAARLGLVPERGVRVRITGGVALGEEELRSVSSGMLRTGVLALIAVAVVLALGLGSLRLVVITLVTLVSGLVWTAAFAAVAVGHLNMISVAFAVLYIGLGVDYAVHYGLRYRELLRAGAGHEPALTGAASDVGGALALCAVTTGIGFFAFVPTRFAGVSELGLIAGVGMFISLAATLTLMPALLGVLRLAPGDGRRAVNFAIGSALDRLGQDHGRVVRRGALLVALGCAVVATGARFDDNPLNLRDPQGEALSTYRELVADGETWSLDLLAADPAAARRIAGRLDALPEVRRVVSLGSFVPPEQESTLDQVEELALLLGPDLARSVGQRSDPGESRAALAGLAATLERLSGPTPAQQRLRSALARLHAALERDPGTGATLLRALDEAVTGTLAGELARLGQVLEAERITAETLPPMLLRDWRSADGRVRLRVDASGNLNRREDLVRFVEAVREVAPDAVGTPIVHLESARVVVTSFVQAFALAFVCIVVILFLVLRRPGAVLMAVAPLLLAALSTVAVLTALQVPFNFANVIALPLLLGVGVDSGIHMLTRARMAGDGVALAASGTARGVVTSAVTTAVSFGNLAFSAHPGTASMGVVLSVGMVCVLVATLLVMPALAPVCLGRDPPRVAP